MRQSLTSEFAQRPPRIASCRRALLVAHLCVWRLQCGSVLFRFLQMITIALVGAGGKMGCRITDNIKTGPHKVHYLEVSAPGIERLAKRGVSISMQADSLPQADVVILAVPDVAILGRESAVGSGLRSG